MAHINRSGRKSAGPGDELSSGLRFSFLCYSSSGRPTAVTIMTRRIRGGRWVSRMLTVNGEGGDGAN